LTNLTELNIKNIVLEEFPKGIKNLVNLEKLILDSTYIQYLSNDIKKFKKID